MPGLAAQSSVSVAEQLLLVSLVVQLRRVVTNFPGDRAFIRSLTVDVSRLSDSQRAHMMRLAWRYRLQLPPGLRPGADPDQPTDQKVT
jgi:hypothetical protein